MAELDLTGEEPSPAADPVITTQEPPEKATLVFELNGWKPRLHLRYSVEGPSSWAPIYFALVLLLAIASALAAHQLLPPGATWGMVALTTAGSGGAVIFGGAAFLMLWPRVRKHSNHSKGSGNDNS